MATFESLKDLCNNFEQHLQQISNEHFSAKLEETPEHVVAKKTRDILLFTLKSRLLSAKQLSLQPQITDSEKVEDTTLINYTDTVTQRLIERCMVKSVTQCSAVKKLVTAPDGALDAELLDRKCKILTALSEPSALESELDSLEALLKERQDTLAEVRARWHDQVGELRHIKEQATGDDEVNTNGHHYRKLSVYTSKLEQMRWLISRLTTPRTRGYDWLSDPHDRLRALKLARKPCNIDSFLSGNE